MAGGSQTRMLCAHCGTVARPDTRVVGSDTVELALWCLLLLPGLLYCAWRNVQQRRICPACGSSQLIRESRASRRRIEADPGAAPPPELQPGGRRVHSGRRLPWMAAPRTRFRRVTRGGGALAGVAFLAFTFVGINTVSTRPVPAQGEAGRARHVQEKDPSQVAEERSRRLESARYRECDRLCAEFHHGRAKPQRDCIENCMTKLFDSPAEAPAKDACAELLDASACDFVSGNAPLPSLPPVGAGPPASR